MNAFDRNSNIKIIEELRNSQKIVLDDYIDKVLIPLKKENSNFLKTLYKDILYVLDDLDKPDENDLAIENGDLVIEDGDFKLTGYQTRLHDICIWLHQEFIEDSLTNFDFKTNLVDVLKKAEQKLLKKENYTIEYREKLDIIKKSIKKERKVNFENKSNGLKKYLDFDILELKPNFLGIGINFNELINKMRKK